MRHRISLVRLGTQLRNRIHAVAADQGYDRPASYWTGPGRGWLAGLDLPATSREIITDCLAVIGALAVLTGRLDGELHQHAKADPRVKALRTLPGVGEFTALVMVAEIGDITRFPSARKLASWAGLTPTVRGSDLKARHGHIFEQGSAWLRWALNQAAQTAKRSPDFAASYAAIAKRRGKKIATIERPQAGNPRPARSFPGLIVRFNPSRPGLSGCSACIRVHARSTASGSRCAIMPDMLLTPDELLTTTRSVRKRLNLTRPVPLEVVKECLKIALQAPSGGMRQGWHWIVVTDPELRAQIGDFCVNAGRKLFGRAVSVSARGRSRVRAGLVGHARIRP